jgi:hypothetical protein
VIDSFLQELDPLIELGRILSILQFSILSAAIFSAIGLKLD